MPYERSIAVICCEQCRINRCRQRTVAPQVPPRYAGQAPGMEQRIDRETGLRRTRRARYAIVAAAVGLTGTTTSYLLAEAAPASSTTATTATTTSTDDDSWAQGQVDRPGPGSGSGDPHAFSGGS